MKIKKTPINIYFLWHKENNNSEVKEYVNIVSQRLHERKALSGTGLRIPIYYRSEPMCDKTLKKINLGEAERNIIFILATPEMVLDKKWKDYIENLYNECCELGEKRHIIRIIAFDSSARNLHNSLWDKNQIRFYDLDGEEKNYRTFLIRVIHEISRIISIKNIDEIESVEPIHIFLSYSRSDEQSKNLVKQLSIFLSTSVIRAFVDVSGVQAGDHIEQVLTQKIRESTFVAILSNSYGLRYWCQLEIMKARSFHRPCLVIDILESYQDRLFPYLGNMPWIYTQTKKNYSRESLETLAIEILIETLRRHYNNMYLKWFTEGLEEKENIDIHPYSPDPFLLLKKSNQLILYPDPPILPHEESELNQGISPQTRRFATPLSFSNHLYQSEIRVGISVATPKTLYLSQHGLSESHLNGFLNDLSIHLLRQNVGLNYGGDFRKNGFTRHLFDLGLALKMTTCKDLPKIKIFSAWPIWEIEKFNQCEEFNKWLATHSEIAEVINSLPDAYQHPEITTQMLASDTQKKHLWTNSLTCMRNKMILGSDEDCARKEHARILLGGQMTSMAGFYPGILEEFAIAKKNNIPVFLLGGFGGCAHAMTDMIEPKKPCKHHPLWPDESLPELAEHWEAMLNYENTLQKPSLKYHDMLDCLKETSLSNFTNNGLTEDQNRTLFTTTNIDEAIMLILHGMEKIEINH